jgi:hypothetical protein
MASWGLTDRCDSTIRGLCLSLLSLSLSSGGCASGHRVRPTHDVAEQRPATATAPYRLCGFGQVAPPAELPVECKGKSVTFASAIAWLDQDRFAFARWDGAAEVYRRPKAEEFGPVLTSTFVTPSKSPVTMIQRLDAHRFVSSNDAGSLMLWSTRARDIPEAVESLPYDARLGSATSATLVTSKGSSLLATGHAGGFVLIWQLNGEAPHVTSQIDVRSERPLPPPASDRHVRGLVPGRAGRLIAGSEDGDLTVIDIAAAKVVFRARYSESAQRGINAIAVEGDVLAVVNCAVGSGDRNLWLFKIDDDRLSPRGSTNLVLDTTRKQVFAFGVAIVRVGSGLKVLATTEENLIWSAEVTEELGVGRRLRAGLDPDAASALAWNDEAGLLAAGAYNPHLLAPR